MTTKKLFLHTMLPLFVGFCIYVFFHSPNLVIHHYLHKLCKMPNYYTAISKNWLVNFILHHLPDMLWAYSLGIFLNIFLKFVKSKYLKAAVILVIVSFTEVVQIFYPLRFTFDWIDLVLILTTQLIVFYKYENN